jgi:hypothetical protein
MMVDRSKSFSHLGLLVGKDNVICALGGATVGVTRILGMLHPRKKYKNKC